MSDGSERSESSEANPEEATPVGAEDSAAEAGPTGMDLVDRGFAGHQRQGVGDHVEDGAEALDAALR